MNGVVDTDNVNENGGDYDDDYFAEDEEFDEIYNE